MANRNPLLDTPPYPVEHALAQLGENLRTARLRRNFTREEVGERIGAGTRAIASAEQGKASTGIGIYLGLLWAYDLLGAIETLADPTQDKIGLANAAADERARARRSRELDDEF